MIRRCLTWLGMLGLFTLAVTFAGLKAEEEKPADRGDTPSLPAASDTQSSDTSVETDSDENNAAGETAADSDNSPEVRAKRRNSLIILGIGIAVVLGLIIFVKVNAFIALITSAMVVSLLAVAFVGAGQWSESMTRVAAAFGSTAGSIGIVIAMAAVIGKCMLDSGAADRIVRFFLNLFGEILSPIALMLSGFVLAVPVFFDTVFYLLVPLARSLYRKTGRNYLKYILAIGAGGAITHTLVPPTPGPLVMAATLKFDVGVMMIVGGLVALPAAIAGLIFAVIADRFMDVPMRKVGGHPDPEPLKDSELPSLALSLLPVILPVLMISANTIVTTLQSKEISKLVEVQQVARDDVEPSEYLESLESVQQVTGVLGNANFALLVSTVIAIWLLATQRGLSRVEMADVVEHSLMSGGVIILITAGGGAFGAMLKVAEVGQAIQGVFAGVGGGSGFVMLLLGFSIAAVLKVAQGSSTAAMIIGSGMLAEIATPATLGFHPVYLATAIGAGSLIGSWMNDSGFWIFAKMGGLTEVEALKSWTIMLLVLGVVSFVTTVILSIVLPLV